MMVTKKITSLQHPLVLEWVRLRQEKEARLKAKKVLIMGKRMVSEVKIETLIVTETDSGIAAKDTYLVTNAILKKITGLGHPDGFAGVTTLPGHQDLSKKKFLVILDKISDPGNMGTLLRTALALKWEGVIITPGTVDLFNDKVLRAGKGAHFHLPYSYMTPSEILDMNLHLYSADLNGKALDNIELQKPRAIILSHETQGAGDWSDSIAQQVMIPMHSQSESLNVAVSGAIILYVMRPF